MHVSSLCSCRLCLAHAQVAVVVFLITCLLILYYRNKWRKHSHPQVNWKSPTKSSPVLEVCVRNCASQCAAPSWRDSDFTRPVCFVFFKTKRWSARGRVPVSPWCASRSCRNIVMNFWAATRGSLSLQTSFNSSTPKTKTCSRSSPRTGRPNIFRAIMLCRDARSLLGPRGRFCSLGPSNLEQTEA